MAGGIDKIYVIWIFNGSAFLSYYGQVVEVDILCGVDVDDTILGRAISTIGITGPGEDHVGSNA